MTPALPNWDDYKKRVSQGEVAQTWVGILLAAALMSLGAPFWFDILNKFMNVRNAGKPPEKNATGPAAQSQAAPTGTVAQNQAASTDAAPAGAA